MRCRAHNREHCDIHCHLDTIHHTQVEILNALQRIERNERTIIMKVNEALTLINDETNTIADEQTKLGQRVDKLIASLSADRDLTPEQQAEVDAITKRNTDIAKALKSIAADPEQPVPAPIEPAPTV